MISSPQRFTFLLVGAAALHAFLWASFMPPAQVMDEEAHFAYVEFLAINKHIPLLHHDFNMTRNWREAIEASGFSRIRLQTYEKPDYVEYHDLNPKGEMMPGTYFSGSPGGPPLYYMLLAPLAWLLLPFETLTRLYTVRMSGMLFAAISAAATFKLLVRAIGDGPSARAIAAVTTMLPTAHFLLGGVTNDSAFIAVAALASLGIVSFVERGMSVSEAAVAGAACGIAYWIKPYAVTFAALLFLIALLQRQRPCAARVAAAAAFSALFLAVISPWLFFAYKHYGGSTAHAQLFKTVDPPSWMHIFRSYADIASLPSLFSQALGIFGWLDTLLPKPIRGACAIIFAVGWLSFIHAALRGRVDAKIIWLALIALFHAASIIAIAVWLMRSTGYRLGLQGRYFLYPLAAWTAPAFIGIRSLAPRLPLIEPIAVLLAVALALSAFALAVIPRYYL